MVGPLTPGSPPRFRFLSTLEALPEGEKRFALRFSLQPSLAAVRLTEAMLFCLMQFCYVC